MFSTREGQQACCPRLRRVRFQTCVLILRQMANSENTSRSRFYPRSCRKAVSRSSRAVRATSIPARNGQIVKKQCLPGASLRFDTSGGQNHRTVCAREVNLDGVSLSRSRRSEIFRLRCGDRFVFGDQVMQPVGFLRGGTNSVPGAKRS